MHSGRPTWLTTRRLAVATALLVVAFIATVMVFRTSADVSDECPATLERFEARGRNSADIAAHCAEDGARAGSAAGA